MVDPIWLQNHKEYDDEQRIADNGKLWGDWADPEDAAEARLEVKAVKGKDSNRKRKAKSHDIETRVKKGKAKMNTDRESTITAEQGQQAAAGPSAASDDDALY